MIPCSAPSSTTDATRTELAEAQAQQRIVDAKRVQLVKELRRQLKQELLINREMQVTIRCQQDELGDARSGGGGGGGMGYAGSRMDGAIITARKNGKQSFTFS
jgi:hypothetical protein